MRKANDGKKEEHHATKLSSRKFRKGLRLRLAFTGEKAYCHHNDSLKKKYLSFDLDAVKRIDRKIPKILEKLGSEQEKGFLAIFLKRHFLGHWLTGAIPRHTAISMMV